MRRALRIVGVTLAFITTSAQSCDGAPKAPSTGMITDIAYDSRACHDEAEKTMSITYRPAGTDPNGAEWPPKIVCVTPETAEKYKIGSKYP